MATTPPPTRARTPPTPLHGPKYDIYEPYSPRRSTRIHNKLDTHSSHGVMSSMSIQRPEPPHLSDRITPRKPNSRRTNGFSFSPPASPSLSTDRLASPVSHRATGMLPTPAKTPRKRGFEDSKVVSTGRVLFPSHPTMEEVMPTPRRARKGRKHNIFSLDSLAEDGEGGGNIEVYTDSRDRMPEIDEDEDNPFIIRRSTRRTRASSGFGNGEIIAVKPKHGMSKEVDEAVANGEGLVYVFRGKKIFRKFDDPLVQHTASDDSEGVSDHEVVRRAGATARQRLTRSSIKPRLLFPPKEPSPAPDDGDEEALTDIEGPVPESECEMEKMVATPTKRRYQPATPPATGRKTRSSDAGQLTPATSPRSTRARRDSPFDAWLRTKSMLPAKRTGEVLERGEGAVGKRTRSGSHHGV